MVGLILTLLSSVLPFCTFDLSVYVSFATGSKVESQGVFTVAIFVPPS